MPLTTNLGVSQQDAGVAARVELRESVRRFRNRAWQSIGSIESSSLHPCFFALAQANNQLAHRNKRLRLTRGDRDCKLAPEADSLASTSAVGPRGRSLFFGPSEARHQQAFAASIRIVIPTPQMSSFVHSHSL